MQFQNQNHFYFYGTKTLSKKFYVSFENWIYIQPFYRNINLKSIKFNKWNLTDPLFSHDTLDQELKYDLKYYCETL